METPPAPGNGKRVTPPEASAQGGTGPIWRDIEALLARFHATPDPDLRSSLARQIDERLSDLLGTIT